MGVTRVKQAVVAVFVVLVAKRQGITANLFQAAGLALIAVGGFVIAAWLGLFLAGAGCIALGIALEH